MGTQVDEQVKDALTISNVKTVGEAAAFFTAQSMNNHVKHQQRLDQLAEAHLGKVLNNFTSVDPAEAVATAKLFKGESDSAISSLLAQLASGQIGAKTAQSTPGDVAGDVARLGAALGAVQAQIAALTALVQQTVKVAQSTPPSTHG